VKLKNAWISDSIAGRRQRIKPHERASATYFHQPTLLG